MADLSFRFRSVIVAGTAMGRGRYGQRPIQRSALTTTGDRILGKFEVSQSWIF
jgi:hypothetical protein